MRLEEGRFAIVIEDFGTGLYWYEDPIEKRAAGLAFGFVPGFDYRKHALHIVRVDHVMPITFSGRVYCTRNGSFGAPRKRIETAFILHVAATLPEALEIRSRLLGIGERADQQVTDETRDYIAEVERRVRAEALGKLKAILPDVFGSAA
jgi:hypothetical protein